MFRRALKGTHKQKPATVVCKKKEKLEPACDKFKQKLCKLDGS
jgi:hypothetical protein